MYISVSMARGWPIHRVISACKIGLHVEKYIVHGECPLFPKADIQTAGNYVKIGSAFGCGFNWSMQHLISNYREEDVENEVSDEDLLHRY